ncbi:MAG: hypothetical protein QM597_06785 [Aeromicrobium sp.]|uniref:hypothetical protein n=1 Tax=Aeromicrobium sp. TaxID=1871063 RepID=UPI0039E68624
MTALETFLDDYVSQLRADGFVRATADLEEVNPPGIWVCLDTIDAGGLDLTRCEIVTRLYLVSGHDSQRRALADLAPMHSGLIAAGYVPSEPVTLVGLAVPSQQRELFALRFTTTDIIP